jgi:allophanate hydrolase subunit 1
MADDKPAASVQALMAKFKALTEATLATVREVKAAAQRDGLLDVYRMATTHEQQLLETLQAMEAEAAAEQHSEPDSEEG